MPKDIKLSKDQLEKLSMIIDSHLFIIKEVEALDKVISSSEDPDILQKACDRLKSIQKKHDTEFKILINYLNSQNLPLTLEVKELQEKYL